MVTPARLLEPIQPTAPPLTGLRIMHQQWRQLAFLHWRVDPSVVAPLLPRGLRPDVHDGSTWVGLIPFRMVGAGLGHGPAIPWLGTFAETNVRLYSVDQRGRRGVVFRSLEVTRLPVVIGARLAFATPYMWARMSIAEEGGVITYRSRRRWPSRHRQTGEIVLKPLAALTEPDPCADFLTARWGLHTSWLGRTLYVPNAHEPWPLRRAEVLKLDDGGLLEAAGLPGLVGRPADSVLWSSGVTTDFALPRRA